MLRFAVIGCGVISPLHCWAIKQHPRAQLSCVCDVIPEKAEKMAAEYDCHHTTDYHSILSDPNIDAITIALPHHLHHTLFADALAAGKHVICEKPLATTPSDLEKMIELAQSTSLTTSGIFQHRFAPLIETLIDCANKNQFGQISSGSIYFSCDRTQAYYDSADWRGIWRGEGGGTLINQAIHTIDLLTPFFGRPISVDGKVARKRLPNIQVEDFAQATVLYNNNAQVDIHVLNVENGGWSANLTLSGSKGQITIDGSETIIDLKTDSTQLRDSLRKAEAKQHMSDFAPRKECYGTFHNMAFADFIQAIENNTQPRLTIPQAAIANELVLAIYHSTSTATPVTLPLSQYTQPTLA